VIIFSLLAALGVVVFRSVRGAFGGRQWTDSLASSLSSRRDLAELTETAVEADSRRLGATEAGLGIRLGLAVLTMQWVLSTYEWSQVWIMGTRAGKTRAVAVPGLVEHGGAAVATSNKPDIVYLTRGPRSELGRVWIQDPQAIYGDGPTWWWNPLSFVTDLARAEQLASIWLASRVAGDVASSTDAYFEPMGRELLADLLMAAAISQEPVTRVLDWLQFPDGGHGLPDPTEALRAHGMEQTAANIESKIAAAADERSGIYGTARSAVGFLRNPEFLAWITPTGPADERPQFHPHEFVRSRETLYLLSKEGAGSARAITAALTAAVYAAGEQLAEQHGGRVPTPILFCLDEAANVCRWPELPSLYSHAGSKGLILVVIVQSKRQGDRAWGVDGFGMMWSAANIAVAGRGINDADHLSDLTRLIGDRQIRDGSVTVGSGGHRSSSTQNREERILTEADLRALPRGRAILFASGARSILLRLVDLSERDDANRIAASEAAFKPAAIEKEVA
jgi:type IV secretory pathway TraG/TraD family ATPase VirD4